MADVIDLNKKRGTVYFELQFVYDPKTGEFEIARDIPPDVNHAAFASCLEALANHIKELYVDEPEEEHILTLEQHEKFAWLCAEDICFWSKADDEPLTPCLVLNDVFVRGSDAHELTGKDIEDLYDIMKFQGGLGVVTWASERLGITPLRDMD